MRGAIPGALRRGSAERRKNGGGKAEDFAAGKAPAQASAAPGEGEIFSSQGGRGVAAVARRQPPGLFQAAAAYWRLSSMAFWSIWSAVVTTLLLDWKPRWVTIMLTISVAMSTLESSIL